MGKEIKDKTFTVKYGKDEYTARALPASYLDLNTLVPSITESGRAT